MSPGTGVICTWAWSRIVVIPRKKNILHCICSNYIYLYIPDFHLKQQPGVKMRFKSTVPDLVESRTFEEVGSCSESQSKELGRGPSGIVSTF